MGQSMATVKVTITLPAVQLKEIKDRVKAGKSVNVSRFVQDSVQRSLNADREFKAMLDEMLEETGRPLTPQERREARQILSAGRTAKRSKPRSAA